MRSCFHDACVKPKCLLPHMSSIKKGSCKNLNRRVSIGIKLTCGLEILARSYSIGDWGNIAFISLSCPLRKSDILKMFWKAQRSITNDSEQQKHFLSKKRVRRRKNLVLILSSMLTPWATKYTIICRNRLRTQMQHLR